LALAELARGVWWTGFPWGAGGYAHVEGPLAALARWVGVYGVGAVAAALAMLLVQVRMPICAACGPGRWCCCRCLGVAAAWGTAPWSVPHAHPGAQDASSWRCCRATSRRTRSLNPAPACPGAAWYRDQLLQPHRALVVAPETALPLLPQQLPEGYLEGLQDRFAQPERAALWACRWAAWKRGYTNSVLGLRAGQSEVYRYDKHHLVPFGEFIPPLFRWFTDLMNIPLGDFNRGAGPASFDWRGSAGAQHLLRGLVWRGAGCAFVSPAGQRPRCW
jgi:apolipoprotein N-acyltransferase